MRVVHDPDICEAHGLCSAIDPDRFDLGEDDLLTIHKAEVPESDLAAVRQAVESCPRQALKLIDE